MSYKLGQLPSPGASLPEIADFMEFQCLIGGEDSYSTTSGKDAMGILGEDDRYEEEDYSDFDSALAVVEDRKSLSLEHYPFEALSKTIRVRTDVDDIDRDIYVFLLLATRENMSSRKVAGGVDGTALFEKLCAVVLANYFGSNCKLFVFGTGGDNHRSFEERVQEFLDTLNEGKILYRKPDCSKNNQKDAKLDIVAFIPFPDERKGQFIAFGQCKTGTNWRPLVSQLNPDAFCKSYCSPPPGFLPITIFMVSESFSDNWEDLLRLSNGILFDRTRIMAYLPREIDDKILSQIRKWNYSVISNYRGDNSCPTEEVLRDEFESTITTEAGQLDSVLTERPCA